MSLVEGFFILKEYRIAAQWLPTLLRVPGKWKPQFPSIVDAAKAGALVVLDIFLTIGKDHFSDEDVNVTMYEAAAAGKVACVKRLLLDPRVDQGVLLSTNLTNHGTPLAIACKKGHLDVVKAILSDGKSDPGVLDNYALHMACDAHRLDIANALLDDPRVSPIYADPTGDRVYGFNNILTAACRENLAEFVKRLLKDPRVDPSKSDSVGAFALEEAIIRCPADVVSMLLSDPRVDPSSNGNRPMYIACARGYTVVVSMLMEMHSERVSPYKLDRLGRHGSPFCCACINGSVKVVEMLLESPHCPDIIDDLPASPLLCQLMSDEKSIPIMRLILESGKMDPGAYGNIAVITACGTRGREDYVRLLLQDPRVDPSVESNRCIKGALHDLNFIVVQLLLDDDRVHVEDAYFDWAIARAHQGNLAMADELYRLKLLQKAKESRQKRLKPDV